MRSTFTVRETASLGQQMLNAPVGINGLIQTVAGLQLPCTESFSTKRNVVWYQIYRKSVIMIQIWFDVARCDLAFIIELS